MLELSALPLRCQVCRLGCASLPGPCPFHEVRRPAGSVLVHQDERPSSVWYVRRGQVVLGSISESGSDQSSAVRGPDTLLAFEALLGEPVPYRITALTDVVLCVIEASAFRDWVGTLSSPMGAVLELALSEAHSRAAERHALEGTAVRRVSRFLLDRHRKNGNGAGMIPQHVLARVLGMRPETLSRALATLRKSGAIAPGRGVRVADSSRLEKLAGE
jgi:CRP/FNR family transcriptional regulator, cyclic AMP receptor protein